MIRILCFMYLGISLKILTNTTYSEARGTRSFIGAGSTWTFFPEIKVIDYILKKIYLYVLRNILRSEAGSITSWSGTNIIRESYNLKDWQQFSLPISLFFFMSVNGSDNHANCQESKKCWFPHGCCVECLCRSKSERQVKLKWLNHLIFLGKREDRKSCAHMSAKLNQLISKLALSSMSRRGLIILAFHSLLILLTLCAKRRQQRALFSFASMLFKSWRNSKVSPTLVFSRIKMVLVKSLAILFMIFCSVSYAEPENEFQRKQKVLSLFSVVTFPNEYT